MSDISSTPNWDKIDALHEKYRKHDRIARNAATILAGQLSNPVCDLDLSTQYAVSRAIEIEDEAAKQMEVAE